MGRIEESQTEVDISAVAPVWITSPFNLDRHLESRIASIDSVVSNWVGLSCKRCKFV